MQTLNEIPRAFLELHAAGRFDYWGAPYATLTEAARKARIRTHLDRVLWWSAVEWDRTPEEILAFEGDGVLRPGLVPFAGNGNGDAYCWYPRWQDGPEPPVVFFVHDELESTLFARDFAETLQRCLLQTFADEWAFEGLDAGARHALFRAHHAIVRPYLEQAQSAVLDRIAADPSPAACRAADDTIAKTVGDRRLVGAMQPVRYTEKYFRDDPASLVRAYERSRAFYRELVVDEGLEQHRGALDAVEERLRELAKGR